MGFLKSIIFGLITLMSFSLWSQGESSSSNQVVVELNSGTKITGDVIDWQPDEYIILKMSWGQEVKFGAHQIEKITQAIAINQLQGPYTFNENGLYCAARIQFITANDGNRANGVNGLGGSFSIGHRFNRWFALGGGIGYDRFIWKTGENIIPLFAEVSGFINPSNTSLFYNIQAGYGFAFSDQEILLTDAQGGFMFYPSLGVRFGREQIKWTLDFGYKFQDAQFTYRDVWTPTTSSIQDITYKRLCLRLGILL